MKDTDNIEYRRGYHAGWKTAARRARFNCTNLNEPDDLLYRAVRALTNVLADLDPRCNCEWARIELSAIRAAMDPTAHQTRLRIKRGRRVMLRDAAGMPYIGTLVSRVGYCNDSTNQIWTVVTPDGLKEVEVSSHDIYREETPDNEDR